VQVGEAALDHPALAAEPRAVGGPPARDPVSDAAGAQDAPVLVVVVAAIGEDAVRLGARPADLAGDRAGGQVVQERHQLGDIVAVAAGERDRQGDPGRIDQEMVL
jgi:hypothetical protein